MKKYLLLFFLILSFIPFYGINTVGEWIPLEGGIFNTLTPKISLGIIEKNGTQFAVVNILIYSNEAGQIKESDTKALIKLDDGAILELDSFAKSASKYDPKVYSGILYKLYRSAQSYIIKEEDLEKLLKYPITKVRVERENGDRLDIDIKNKQGKKIMKKLNESWEYVREKQGQRIHNENSDIKDDF